MLPLSHVSSHITYLSKSWSVEFIVTTLLLNHVSSHITYLFSNISLLFFYAFYLFINAVVYGYIFSNFPPSLLPFYLPTTINIREIIMFVNMLLITHTYEPWVVLFTYLVNNGKGLRPNSNSCVSIHTYLSICLSYDSPSDPHSHFCFRIMDLGSRWYLWIQGYKKAWWCGWCLNR